MSLQGKIEAIIYAAEEPVTLDQLAALLKRDVLGELAAQASMPTEPSRTAAEAQSSPAPSEGASGDSTAPVAAQPQDDSSENTPPEAPIATASASEPPSEAQQHPELAPDAQEPLSAPETLDTAEVVDASAAVNPATTVAAKKRKAADPELARVKAHLRSVMETVIASYTTDERGVEIRQIAGGYRMATKPEHHDLVRAFAKSLKPPIKLSLQALETLAIIAYKQPVTAPEIADIRGVDAGGVLGTLLDRKLITTAGRKQVIGRPIQYKTTKEFLMRFGMNDLGELPSMEEFEKLAQEQTDMFSRDVLPETGPAPADTGAAEEGEEMPDREGDYSSGADTAESVLRAQVGAIDQEPVPAAADSEGAPDAEPQRAPDEPGEPADAGDRSDGADTSETIVREQMERDKG